MKRLAMIASLAAVIGGSAGPAQAGLFDPNLEAALAEAGENDVVSALVYLVDQVNLPTLTDNLDLQRATLPVRHEVVVRALQERAADTQGNLLEELEALKATGAVLDYQPFWIANCIRVDGVKRAIELIAGHEDVDMLYYNYPISLTDPVATRPAGRLLGGRGPEPGIEAVRAPEVWAMGITGNGVLVSTLDTGVDGNHPALASRWRGLDPAYAGHPEWAFFDPVTHWQFPQDSGSHGTHTMGSVCGGAPGDEVGVAPGAEWIHAAVIDRVSIEQTVADAILAFQWLIDPDENPNTNWDVPSVCSNSWGLTTGHGYPPCDETFWVYLDACEAAGIVILFSAGNEGYSGLRRPADRATDDFRTCAVAAVDANNPNWPIASFSSRGPTYCTPDQTAAIKPDIAAPGVDVRSSVPGGGYSQYSGTSMASPHVNGVVALMREACPDLSVEEIKEIIYQTAYDLGSPGEDNDYGWGMIDAYEAVNMAFDWCGPSPPRAYDAYYEVPVDTPSVLAMLAVDHDGGPFPISYIITSLPPTGHTLTDIGNDHVIQPGELPYTLVDNGNEVLYTPVDGYYGDDEFHFKATDGGEPPEGGESEEATVSILVLYGPPVIITETLPDGFMNVPYGPFALEVEGGQPELEWMLITDEYAEDNLGENQFDTVGVAKGWHADDQSWSFALPFAFPYFGNMYTSVWVCSNGFLDFATNNAYWGNSDQELIVNRRIAPLWDDLRTDSDHDIYIDISVAGQVTFRWDAETYSGGYQCNFSCTLYQEGTIEFHYGSGNNPVTPTIGISNGDGEAYLLSQYNNAGNLNNADSLRIYLPSPLPEGMILSPDGVLSGTPLEAGEFNPQVFVIDSLGRSDEADLTLTVAESNPGDINGDGVVNTEDLLLLLAAWGDCPGCPEDINGDGVVNTTDLLILLANWG